LRTIKGVGDNYFVDKFKLLNNSSILERLEREKADNFPFRYGSLLYGS
jgi:hypothetical protein